MEKYLICCIQTGIKKMDKKKMIFTVYAFSMLALIASASALSYRLLNNISLQQLKMSIGSLGMMTPVVFVLLCVLRGIFFLPCGLMSALGGMLFGAVYGTFFTLIGLTAGSFCTFHLARYFGKSWAQRILGHRYDKYEGYISRDSFLSLFLMRVVPILPFDVVSCIAGISRVRAGRFVFATLAGSLPGVFIYVFFGDSIRELSLKRVVISVGVIILFAAMPFLYRYLMKLIHRTA